MKWLNLPMMMMSLSGVLAHETGHVINQHAMRAVAQSMAIAIAVGLVFGIDDSFIEEITTLSTSLILSNQSRKFETEADQVSLEILQKLGRDPESMVKFFDKGGCRMRRRMQQAKLF
jgi:predicted Zn-dependent protease